MVESASMGVPLFFSYLFVNSQVSIQQSMKLIELIFNYKLCCVSILLQGGICFIWWATDDAEGAYFPLCQVFSRPELVFTNKEGWNLKLEFSAEVSGGLKDESAMGLLDCCLLLKLWIGAEIQCVIYFGYLAEMKYGYFGFGMNEWT